MTFENGTRSTESSPSPVNHNPVSAPPPPEFTASQIDIVEQLLLVGGKEQTKNIDKTQSNKTNVAQKKTSNNISKSSNTKKYVISLSGMVSIIFFV